MTLPIHPDTLPVGPVRRGNEGVRSLQMKQVLWKLLPLHWISSAWYAVFSQAAHLAPPPQFGILEKQKNNLRTAELLNFSQSSEYRLKCKRLHPKQLFRV